MRRENVFLAVIFLSACATAPDTTLTTTLEATELQVATLDLDALHTQTFATIEALPLIETPTPYVTPIPTEPDYFAKNSGWISPNGEYVAVAEYFGGFNSLSGNEIRILDKNQQVVQSTISIAESEIIPIPFIFRDHWSPDSQYFYYGYFADGEGMEPLFDGRSLVRLDIQTGQRAVMIDCLTSIAWGFSKNDESLAYICYDEFPYHIAIRDLSTQDEFSFVIPFDGSELSQAGKIIWSSDNTEIAFFLLDLENFGVDIYRLNIEDKRFRAVVQDLNMEIYSVEKWTEEDILIITADYVGSSIWYEVDMSTGAITSIDSPIP